MSPEKYQGCLLGLALGDALGAPYEGGPLERTLWRLIGTTSKGEMRWTDDTQMSLDLAESLAEHRALDADDVARRFAASYHWSRGYGPGAARLLKRIRRGMHWQQANRAIYPEGSYGNGGAMRAPVIGLYFAQRPGMLLDAARTSASITHAHPLGIEGAVLLASATALALAGEEPLALLRQAASHCSSEAFMTRLAIAEKWLAAGDAPAARDVARALGNKISASESCVTGVYAALRFMHQPFLDMLRFIAAGGGDVDTISAMAGAVWGAANGAGKLPAAHIEKIEQRDRLMQAAAVLYGNRPGNGLS